MRAARSAAAAGLVAAAALVAVPSPAAAAVSGALTLTAAKGVSIAGHGRTVTLPVTAGSLDVLAAGGTITLRAHGRSLTLAAPRLTLGRRSAVTARVGATRRTVLTLRPTLLRRDQTSLTLPATKVTPAKALQKRLRVTSIGKLAAVATIQPVASGSCPATTAPGTPPDPGTGVPPVESQPAGALPVKSATITWHVRDSFVQYIATGEGTTPSAGASGDAPAADGLVYAYHFPSTGGWCDPATGAARLTFSGTVGFSYRDHGIDLRASDPELELDGPTSRLIFDMAGQRQVIETLDVSKAAVSATGTTLTYDQIPAAIPPGAASSVFAGYYLPGDPFGWVSITFST